MSIFVLVESKLLRGNDISDRVVDVTTDLAEAEAHAAKGVQFEYKEFTIPTAVFTLGAETTVFLREMRDFKEAVRKMQKQIIDATLEEQH